MWEDHVEKVPIELLCHQEHLQVNELTKTKRKRETNFFFLLFVWLNCIESLNRRFWMESKKWRERKKVKMKEEKNEIKNKHRNDDGDGKHTHSRCDVDWFYNEKYLLVTSLLIWIWIVVCFFFYLFRFFSSFSSAAERFSSCGHCDSLSSVPFIDISVIADPCVYIVMVKYAAARKKLWNGN